MLINFEIPSDPSLCKSLRCLLFSPAEASLRCKLLLWFSPLSRFVFHMFGIILLSSGNSCPGGRYWFQSRTGKTCSCIWGREPFGTQSFFSSSSVFERLIPCLSLVIFLPSGLQVFLSPTCVKGCAFSFSVLFVLW